MFDLFSRFSELCSNSTDQEPDKHLEWFYRIVQSWSIERQRALLHYVTGLKRVPATDQFKVMKAADGHIRRLSVLGNKERAVPDNNADTPEHMLFIPAFEEYQAMEEELISVIYNCDEWVRFFLVTYVVDSKLTWNRTKQLYFLLPLQNFH
jgi:HECT-domain (ubiquitin-transferase)